MPFGLQGFHLACFNHSGSLDQGEERAASISSLSGAIHGPGCPSTPITHRSRTRDPQRFAFARKYVNG